MRVLDLFSGLGGWSAAFRDRGHSVTTLDVEPKFKPDVLADILSINSISKLGEFDIILASPPCQAFSKAAGNTNFDRAEDTGQLYPKKEASARAAGIAWHTIYLLYNSSARFFVVENPVGLMRQIIGRPQAEISQCAYGLDYKKPTDLWGRLPPSFRAHVCTDRNQSLLLGRKRCSHAKRKHTWENHLTNRDDRLWGDHTKMAAAKRAVIPYGLSLAMCEAAEKDLGDSK
jgi:hypothetical protein